jgi:hypothetical protein
VTSKLVRHKVSVSVYKVGADQPILHVELEDYDPIRTDGEVYRTATPVNGHYIFVGVEPLPDQPRISLTRAQAKTALEGCYAQISEYDTMPNDPKNAKYRTLAQTLEEFLQTSRTPPKKRKPADIEIHFTPSVKSNYGPDPDVSDVIRQHEESGDGFPP